MEVSRKSHRVLDARTLHGRRKLVARELGARAVELNRFDNDAGQASKEHDERESGQEEIYVPVAGTGKLVVDGVQIALEPASSCSSSPNPLARSSPGRPGSRRWSWERRFVRREIGPGAP